MQMSSLDRRGNGEAKGNIIPSPAEGMQSRGKYHSWPERLHDLIKTNVEMSC